MTVGHPRGRRLFPAVVALLLLLLAALPWLIQAWAVPPLLPPVLVEARQQYDVRVAEGRAAEAQDNREMESQVRIVALNVAPLPTVLITTTVSGTLPLSDTLSGAEMLTATLPITAQLLAPVSPLATPVMTVSTGLTTTVRVTVTGPVTEPAMLLTPTVRVISVAPGEALVVTTRPPPTPTLLTRTPIAVAATATVTLTVPVRDSIPASVTVPLTEPGAATPSTSSNRVTIEDIIQEAALTEQLLADLDGEFAISDLAILISPTGITATGNLALLPAVPAVPVTAHGNLSVTAESLVFVVARIELEGEDVTARYRSRFERVVNRTLYRLLPQRFVQSFVLETGQIRVQSLVRRGAVP